MLALAVSVLVYEALPVVEEFVESVDDESE